MGFFSCPPKVLIHLTALASLVGCPGRSLGQASVPPKGEGEYAMVFQDLYTTQHLTGDGSRIDAGRITLLGLVNSVDLGVTDRFAVTLAAPLGMGKYNGKSPHLLPIDDGNYHGNLQDMGIAVRYNVSSRPLLLTPFMLVSFPMVHYEHFAHSAIGSDAWEVRIGLTAGHSFEHHLRNTYFQVQYSYAIAEAFMNIRPNKSRTNSEFGYFLTRRLAVRALALSQITHGGLNQFADFPDRTPSNPLWRQHDRISRTDNLNLGGGVSYSLTRKLDVFGSLITTVWGANGHALHTGLAVGVSWTFRTPWARPEMAMQGVAAADSWQARINQPPQMQCAH